jgi:NhaP-type Na+/H+ or K+/H+ antiporter
MHSILPFLLAMIAAIVLLEMWATKLKIAYPIVLVVAGLLVSFIPGLPAIQINPDLIFFIFLPPLLFEAAWNISFKEMKKWWRIIGSFAFLVVFFYGFIGCNSYSLYYSRVHAGIRVSAGRHRFTS